jgi:hypothetical protein
MLQAPLDERGQIDWDQWWIDSTNIRASRAAAGARKKGGLRPNRLTTLSVVPKAGLAPSCIS